MTKTIALQNDKKQNSFLSCIVRGTPYEFNVLGRKVQMMGQFYKHKKMREFYDCYWDSFVQGINDIDPSKEFNSNYVAHHYNSLSPLEQFAVQWQCAEIYAFNDKLTYGNFVDVVTEYVSKENVLGEPDLPPNGAA